MKKIVISEFGYIVFLNLNKHKYIGGNVSDAGRTVMDRDMI